MSRAGKSPAERAPPAPPRGDLAGDRFILKESERIMRDMIGRLELAVSLPLGVPLPPPPGVPPLAPEAFERALRSEAATSLSAST